jgi:hypothetical protein
LSTFAIVVVKFKVESLWRGKNLIRLKNLYLIGGRPLVEKVNWLMLFIGSLILMPGVGWAGLVTNPSFTKIFS